MTTLLLNYAPCLAYAAQAVFYVASTAVLLWKAHKGT